MQSLISRSMERIFIAAMCAVGRRFPQDWSMINYANISCRGGKPSDEMRRKAKTKTFIPDHAAVETLPILTCVMVCVCTTVKSKNLIARIISNVTFASEVTGEPCVARIDLSRMTIVHEQILPNHRHAFASARLRRQQGLSPAIHSEDVRRKVLADNSTRCGH